MRLPIPFKEHVKSTNSGSKLANASLSSLVPLSLKMTASTMTLPPRPPAASEEQVDCLALRNMALVDKQLLDPSLFNMLVDDFANKHGERWTYAADTQQAVARLERRRAVLNQAAQRLLTDGLSTAALACDAGADGKQ